MPFVIKKLNQTLRGWANYHRHVMSSETFSRVDNYVYEQLKQMVRKRHRNKPQKWLHRKYWTAAGKNTFAVVAKVKKGVKKVYQVVRICAIGIKRHIKVKAAANPYDPEYSLYFWNRRNRKESKLLPALSARQFRAMFA